MKLRTLPNALKEKAEKELNEVEGRRIEDDISAIKEWIAKQPHLNVRTEDQWILSFLRGCKFSLERTKEKIDRYYTTRTLLPELFDNRDPFLPEIQAALKSGALLPMPVIEGSSNTQVIMFRWHACNPDKISLTTLAKTYFMIKDILLNEQDNCVISGEDIIIEYLNFPLNYFLHLTPTFLKKLMVCLQNVYPVRIHGIYCINSPDFYEKVYSLFKRFMTEKLINRTFIYSKENSDQLYFHVPRSQFPKEYGGDGGTIDEIIDGWKKKVESYREWFLEDGKYRTNEKLRPGQCDVSAELFGVDGSFRSLTID